ncbi:iron dicitrate transport regulator FecR [Xinfangfangia sp. D13-10-4-6]|uniref:FecR family protein n=1 Tax=Pseudogemmobacter hezensis TaxID=2737662 RepID=UPI0015581D54|nr:FecR domain-containing protein [Pseudogemmobacter hezensis]NPD17300.1 iron dicitrate transport regulator FecR [Pseudogemmobacter hezensis]
MCSAAVTRPDPDSKSARLLDEAIDLMMRRQISPDNPVTRKTIAVWRARSPEHDRIWLRVAEAHDLGGLALAPEGGRGLSRRKLILGGAAVAGLGLAGAWAVPRLRLQLLADHITTTAQLLPLELPDGTRITLGPDSAIAGPAPQNPREIELLQGMAWFDVAGDATSPFVLRMGDRVEARTASASFEASRDAGFVNLAVSRGTLSLAGRITQQIDSGTWFRLDPSTGLSEQGTRDTSLAGIWKEGLIVAEAEPLESLVARIARWLPGSVVIAGAKIARARVSGLFDISDPERALAAAVRPTGAQIRNAGGLVTVISAI